MSPFPPKINCFVCGCLKGETNHWYVVNAVEVYVEQTRQPDRDSLEITRFTEKGRGKPACGNNCTQKLVERWLQIGSLEAPRRPAGDPAC